MFFYTHSIALRISVVFEIANNVVSIHVYHYVFVTVIVPLVAVIFISNAGVVFTTCTSLRQPRPLAIAFLLLCALRPGGVACGHPK